MFTCTNFGPCDNHVGKEKMKASDKNENAIRALLLCSLTLIKTAVHQPVVAKQNCRLLLP